LHYKEQFAGFQHFIPDRGNPPHRAVEIILHRQRNFFPSHKAELSPSDSKIFPLASARIPLSQLDQIKISYFSSCLCIHTSDKVAI